MCKIINEMIIVKCNVCRMDGNDIIWSNVISDGFDIFSFFIFDKSFRILIVFIIIFVIVVVVCGNLFVCVVILFNKCF